MANPTCYLHRTTEATDTCIRCLKPICRVCGVIDNMQILCPPCVGEARRGRRLRVAVVLLLAVAALGGGASLLREPLTRVLEERRVERARRPVDWGKYTEEIVKLEQMLEAEPCDRPRMRKLASTLYRAGDYRGVITRADAFIGRCGKFNRVLWTTYESHKQLSEWKEAVEDAAVLIEADPYDKDFRWWRGIAYERMGKLVLAAADYRQSLDLMPSLRSIPFNLASVLEKLGRPCEAILPLEQFLHYHPKASNRDQIRARLERLHLHEKCAGLDGEGRIVIRRAKGAPAFFVEVSVNGGKSGRFIVDTGATYLSMTKSFAEANGFRSPRGQAMLLHTANGVRQSTLITVDRVSVGKLSARRVTAAIMADLDEVDGLLGLSFLSRFVLTLDPGSDKLVIAAR